MKYKNIYNNGTTEPLEPQKNTSRAQSSEHSQTGNLENIRRLFEQCGSGGSGGSASSNCLNERDYSGSFLEPRAEKDVVPVVPHPQITLSEIPRDPAEMFHDAAVIGEGNGLDAWGALEAIALSEGYADGTQYIDDVLTHWRASIAGAKPSTDAGRQAVTDALDLLSIRGRDLALMGWGAVDLFGVDLNGNRHGGAMILRGSTVLDVQGAFITYQRSGEARARTYWRGSVSSDALPFFALNSGIGLSGRHAQKNA